MRKKTITVLSFGEVLFDVIKGREYLGGAPLNFAAHLAKLGAKSYILSACGCDKRGDEVKKQINELDVCDDFLLSDSKHQTGIVNVALSSAGQPDYKIVTDVAWDYINYDAQLLNRMAGLNADAFYYGSLIQRNDVSCKTLYRLFELFDGKILFYDVNIRQNFYNKELIERSLKCASIVKLNDSELTLVSELLFGLNLNIEDFYNKLGDISSGKILIVTRGDKGGSVIWPQGREEISPIKVQVVDAVGAGDAFSAAFVYFYLSGRPVSQSANLANQLGAFVVSQSGAIPTYVPQVIFNDL